MQFSQKFLYDFFFLMSKKMLYQLNFLPIGGAEIDSEVLLWYCTALLKKESEPNG